MNKSDSAIECINTDLHFPELRFNRKSSARGGFAFEADALYLTLINIASS